LSFINSACVFVVVALEHLLYYVLDWRDSKKHLDDLLYYYTYPENLVTMATLSIIMTALLGPRAVKFLKSLPHATIFEQICHLISIFCMLIQLIDSLQSIYTCTRALFRRLMAHIRMVPNNMVPNNMVPNNMVPNNMVPNNMVPNNMVPNNMPIPDRVVPNNRLVRAFLYRNHRAGPRPANMNRNARGAEAEAATISNSSTMGDFNNASEGPQGHIVIGTALHHSTIHHGQESTTWGLWKTVGAWALVVLIAAATWCFHKTTMEAQAKGPNRRIGA
ncbi:hypothetical protein F5B20DRAFT_597509, partial [Whalleya microplaca]